MSLHVNFTIYLIASSVYCFGVFKIFDDLLLPVRARIELLLGPKWSKPVVTCPPCMGSLHGLYLGLIFFGIQWQVLFFCVALCGLNYIIQQLLPEYE
jgi:hypothetical protein